MINKLIKTTVKFLIIPIIFVLLFFSQTTLASNTQKANIIYNHLNSKYQTFSIDQQQEKRKDMKSLFFQIKRKTDNLELINLVTELIQKADRKIDALQDFKEAYQWDRIFQINLENNVIIFTSDPNSLQNRNNSQREIKKDITTDIDLIRQNILNLVNQERQKIWLWVLKINENLNKSAQWHAKYMSETKDFNHTTKAWLKFYERIKNAWYSWKTMWENIAYNQRSEQQVMDAWMNSPWHKANILDPDFTEIGIGFEDYYWVQNFGG